MTIDWSRIFPDASPEPPLAPAALAEQVALACAPLTDDELNELRARDAAAAAARPLVNPLQHYGFPELLLSLYRWSNGKYFTCGERPFDPLFAPAEIREYLVAYGVLLYLPT
ncbi:MAG TPA: hypothetical protein VIA18_15480, partial [Polyangia bacterium]|nr:hypothetical protein [Polyangia bacterium]